MRTIEQFERLEAIGLCGVLTLSAPERRPEIAVRMALGETGLGVGAVKPSAFDTNV